ncbi:protein trichome birefringence-like 2 isoform X2 [Telopea speciosissima]|uniref:protein trichome birefringence-like 2 isoform X2 n=1 Tax=Telopea speciosissima TaxID=54955 RepID=UPI001CC3A0CB|nr:protein trichome birefringence-like 2 isoform X2 [Telopea speciosissima]
MDFKKVLKKLSFSDSKRKVVSGFGLGIGASLIILAVIFLNDPFKVSMFNPFFQGFNGPTGKSSPVSWSFPLSKTANYSSSFFKPQPQTQENNFSQKSKHVVTEETLQTHGEGKSKNVSGEETSQTHQENYIEKPKNVVIGEAHVENFSDKNKNESLISKDERVAEKTYQWSLSGEVGNASANLSSIEKKNVGKKCEGKLVVDPTCPRKSAGKDTDTTSMQNVSNGENVGSLGTYERASETTHEGDLSKKDNKSSSIDYKKVESLDSDLVNCDIFDGRWVRDKRMPHYPAGSCPHIDRDFNCHLNRRPDDGFLRWRWKPNGCDIPRLNSTDFLERLRGKRLVFVGDSLSRNMWESLVCILRHGIRNKKRVYEISGKKEFKKKGFYAFRYEDYKCSIDFVNTPFLVRESSFKRGNESIETLRLDLMDRTTSMYHEADIVVFNTGHWWTHEKTSKGEDYYQEGNHVYPRLKVLEAYKRALNTWARWVDGNINTNRTKVFFRGYSVTHFRGGQWNSGGQCHKEIEPIFNETYLGKYPSKMRVLEYVLQQMKTPVAYLNISRLTDYRKDGHPSIYRKEYKTVQEQIAAVTSQDCSHWCLPGVPDVWNELLYASLLKITGGLRRN